MNAPTLTRLVINPHHKTASHDLTDSHKLHKTLMRLIGNPPGDTPRATAGLLYRIEPDRHPTLLMQTFQPPQLEALPAQYATTDTLTLEPMMRALTPGMTIRYRITAAPTIARSDGTPHRHPVTGKRRGKTEYLTGPAALTWWHQRAQKAGLDLHTCHSHSRPFPPATSKRLVPAYKLTQFEGTARITNITPLVNAVLNGIGKAKTYGAGLLSLAPHS